MSLCGRFLLTGTLTLRRYSKRASSEPRVEACTKTPVLDNFIDLNAFFKASEIHSCKGERRHKIVWNDFSSTGIPSELNLLKLNNVSQIGLAMLKRNFI